jgi:hypothetical protein
MNLVIFKYLPMQKRELELSEPAPDLTRQLF